ncbi:hypothetical protein CDEST_05933 [Colletotrichum destructivum]|uniref:Uncharacterized protein n=1 Tax=Colletotrichum destructivum TaxID=34406 RepID=A0AAX4ID83_9PEZI|nr:hypothetical protein CDEST_05933 [Colletotrichum destructivum]
MTILDGRQFSYNHAPQFRDQESDVATKRPASRSHQGSRPSLTEDYMRVAADEDTTPRFKYLRQKTDVLTILTDCACIVFPMAHVAFVVMLWRLDETEVTDDNSEETWRDAVTILATTFPILFASIVGRLVSEAARWRLEQGATVGSLEQLIGSRTVGGTVLTLFSFRSFNVLAALLFLTWSCSPLGTQALLRMESTTLKPQFAPTAITYFDDLARSQMIEAEVYEETTYGGSEFYASYFGSLASLYTALITTPDTIKSGPMDLWGNVKIPVLHHSESVWKDLPINSSAIEYSSLAGIPLNDFHIGNTTFSIESSYLHLTCGPVGIGLHGNSAPGFVEDPDPNILREATWGDGSRIFHMPNGTWHGYGFTNPNDTERTAWMLAVDRFVDPVWLLKNNTVQRDPLTGLFEDKHAAERERPRLFMNETGIEVGQTNLLFQAEAAWTSSKAPTVNRATSTCRVTQKYVESRVNCTRAPADITPACRVVAQRPSEKKHAPEDITHLSFPKVFNLVSKHLPRTVGGQISYQTEFSLYYLQDPSLKGMLLQETQILKNLTATDLQVRLAQLLNTYLTLSQLSFQITRLGPDNAVSLSNQTATAETTTSIKVFEVSDTWAVVCLLSGAVMLGAGLMGVVFKHRARGPEVLGHVSTVIRDSKYMDFPPEAVRAEGLDLSRNMKGLRIRYGVTGFMKDGEPLIGVGRHEEIEPVNYH